jgi:hypothetical protein
MNYSLWWQDLKLTKHYPRFASFGPLCSFPASLAFWATHFQLSGLIPNIYKRLEAIQLQMRVTRV